MILDTAWTNTPVGYPARHSNVRVASLYLFFRTPRTALRFDFADFAFYYNYYYY